MINIYEKYGYFREGLQSITLKGIDGVEKIQAIMDKLRKNPPVIIGDYKVKAIRDYKSGVIKNLETGEETATNLPVSNVLYFDLEDDAWCCARPSGTEPKIKFYIGVKGNSLKDSDEKLAKLTDALMALAKN